MYVGLYAICVLNWNWWLTQDHFLIKHWSKRTYRCSASRCWPWEYSLVLVSRYSTVRSGTLTWREWGLCWGRLQNTYKQRVLMHGHQGWNVRHGLCHIYMRYVYIWVVYSLCFFCCLFITVTWWYVWCFEWARGNQEEVQACLVTLWLFIISCYSLYKTTLGLLCSWFENNPHFHKYSIDFPV